MEIGQYGLIAAAQGTQHATHEMMATFAGALAAGVVLVIVSKVIRVSAIAILLLGGILLGPQCLGLIHPDALGAGLRTIISLAVGLILFEGGLTLDVKGYHGAPQAIRGVLSRGVLVTWLGSAFLIRVIFGFEWGFSLLAGSLIIVTGPTVIAPLLKRIRVRKRLHSILHWEGVLIDPIGVFIALLCYEWTVSTGGEALSNFLQRIVVGMFYGAAGGGAMALILRRRWIPAETLNIFVLSGAIGIFALADGMAEESGLLAVTVAGFLVGYLAKPFLEGIKEYKAELIELLIGLLFVLLAARLDLTLIPAYGIELLIVLLGVILVVRPLNIFASTTGTDLSIREKLFLSWVAPRGIVAASMASFFTLNLQERGVENAAFLETFTYCVIAGTVLVQGFTAGGVGRLLGVVEPKPRGWLIVGSHALGRRVARFVEDLGHSVVIVDTNGRMISLARRDGLTSLCVDAMTVDAERHPELYGIGTVLAITGNQELNTLICQRWNKELPAARCFRWALAGSGSDTAPAVSEAGITIWSQIRLNKLLSLDAEELDARLSSETLAVDRVRHPEWVLLSSSSEIIQPGIGVHDGGEASVFTLHPFSVRMNLEMHPNWVLMTEAGSMADAYKEMLNSLVDDYPELPVEKLHRQLIDQNEEYSSAIGYAVAMPHTYTEQVSESVVVVAKLKQEISCQHSGEAIDAIFMVLSPPEQPQTHLKALSEISKFIMEADNREQLMAADSVADLRSLFFTGAAD